MTISATKLCTATSLVGSKKVEGLFSLFFHSPLVERSVLGVTLQTALLDDEAHFLEEGGRGRGRLPLQQDLNWPGHRLAELAAAARGRAAALGVFAIGQAV